MRRRARIRAHRFAWPALRAARGLRRARAGSGSGSAWRPLALRWRRPRRATATTLVRDRISPPGAPVPHREVRLVLAPGIERIVRDRLSVASATRRIHSQQHERERLVLSSHWKRALMQVAVHRDGSGVRTWRRRNELRAQTVESRRSRPQAGASAVSLPRTTRAALRSSPPVAARDFAPVHRLHAMRSMRGSATEPTTSTRRSADGSAPPLLPAATIAALQRTVQLVWRQQVARGEATAVTARDLAPAMRESVSPQAGSRARNASPGPAHTAPPPAPAAMPRLDAAFVDRLAEDVIRRVEKRARVERERRGSL